MCKFPPFWPQKLPIPDTDERKLAEDLIRSLGYGGWIPLSLASIIQVFPLLNDRDVFEIIRISWNCVNEFLHNPEIIWEPSKTKGNQPKEMNPQFFGGIIDVSSKSGEEDEAESFQVKWKTPFWTIIRKNITTIGPYIRGIVSIDSMDLDDAYCLQRLGLFKAFLVQLLVLTTKGDILTCHDVARC